jgi:DNA polymerase I-like protein with 3'-5' exonuclease and polymerase domains
MEIGFSFLKTDKEKVKQILQEAIAITNEKLRLNVPLGISIDIGDNYAESH